MKPRSDQNAIFNGLSRSVKCELLNGCCTGNRIKSHLFPCINKVRLPEGKFELQYMILDEQTIVELQHIKTALR